MLNVVGYRCNKCDDFVFSRAEQDARRCSCENITVKGGPLKPVIEFSGDPPSFEVRRFNVTEGQLQVDWIKGRGRYGIVTSYDSKANDDEEE